MLLQRFQVVFQLSSHSYCHTIIAGREISKGLNSAFHLNGLVRCESMITMESGHTIYLSSLSALSNKFILNFTSSVFPYKQPVKAFCDLLVLLARMLPQSLLWSLLPADHRTPGLPASIWAMIHHPTPSFPNLRHHTGSPIQQATRVSREQGEAAKLESLCSVWNYFIK